MKTCTKHGITLKQGGCLQTIYEWCPQCEKGEAARPAMVLTRGKPHLLYGSTDSADRHGFVQLGAVVGTLEWAQARASRRGHRLVYAVSKSVCVPCGCGSSTCGGWIVESPCQILEDWFQ